MKVLDEFNVNDRIRLRVRLTSEEETIQAHSLFYQRSRGVSIGYEPGCPTIARYANKSSLGNLKYIAKF